MIRIRGSRRGLAALAAALLVVLAGCGAGVPAGEDGGDTGAGTGSSTGTVNFYISDQKNAIDQFEHLNATVTSVGVHRVEGGNGSENGSEGGGAWVERNVNATVDLTELQGANATKLDEFGLANGTYNNVFIHVESVEGTLTDGSEADVKLPSNRLKLSKQFTVGNGEEVDFVFDVTVFERGPNGYILRPVAGESGTGDEVDIKPVERGSASAAAGANANGSAGDSENRSEGETGNGDADADTEGRMSFYVSDEENAMGDFDHLNVTVTTVGLHRAGGGDSDGWVEKDVDDRSIDLTTLRGANATRLGTFGVENGTYDRVFVYVSEVNGTLENGEPVNVKLPSSKLQLHKQFTIGNGEAVDFVYDMTVFKAGNSGKYILKPVVSESGTGDEVDIKPVDEDDGDDGDQSADGEALNASFVGDVSAGSEATVEVTRNGTAVENATVRVTQRVDGEVSGVEYATDADGTATFRVEANATELTVRIIDADAEAELEREFGADAGETDSGNDGSGNGTSGNDSNGALRATLLG